MKKTFFFIFITLIQFNIWASDSTVVISDTYNKTTVTGNYKVTFIESTENKVVINNTDSDLEDEKIIVEVKGGELFIYIKNDLYSKKSLEMTVYYSQKLIEVNAKRGAYLQFESQINNDIILNVDTGGDIYVKLNADNVTATIKNGGTINVSGKAKVSDFTVSKGGDLVARDLESEVCQANVSLGGYIYVFVTKSLSAVVKGGGNIKYRGNPEKVTEQVKLGGNIDKV